MTLRLTLLVLYFLFGQGCSSLAPVELKIQPTSDTIYIAACSVLNSDFEIIRKLATGNFCLATADGGYIAPVSSGNDSGLARFGPDGAKLWEIKGHYHHQIKQLDENYILALYSENKKVKNGYLTKFDGIRKINYSTGQVEKEFSTYRELYLKKIKNSDLRDVVRASSPYMKSNFKGVTHEYVHLNAVSFYKNKIVLAAAIRVKFFLDFDLNFIEFIPGYNYYNFNHASKYNVLLKHDFQVLDDDSILFFQNQTTDTNDSFVTYKILHYKENKLIFEFPTNVQDFAFSPNRGGVEKIGSDYLIGFPVGDSNHSIVGIASPDGKWVKKLQIPLIIQDIKKITYPNYLKLNQLR